MLTKGEARRYITGGYNPVEFRCQGFTAVAKFRRLGDYSSFREPGTRSRQERQRFGQRERERQLVPKATGAHSFLS